MQTALAGKTGRGNGSAYWHPRIRLRNLVGGVYLYIMAWSTWESSMETDMAGKKPGYISIAAVKPIDEGFLHDPVLLSMHLQHFPLMRPPVVFLLAAALPSVVHPPVAGHPPWAAEPGDSCSESSLAGPAPCSSPPAR